MLSFFLITSTSSLCQAFTSCWRITLEEAVGGERRSNALEGVSFEVYLRVEDPLSPPLSLWVPPKSDTLAVSANYEVTCPVRVDEAPTVAATFCLGFSVG